MASHNELPPVAGRRARRYRISAMVVLLLGLVSAGAVYWLQSSAPDYSDDPAMLGFNRSEERQLGMLYGKQGQLIEDLNNSLKDPGTQAILIIIAAAVVAAGCFHIARILEDEAKQPAAGSEPDTR